ncbi:hypothetical protein U91I_00228 [alpha proteobacterium U9-1i]|nr:hypothetical protein U91I_00228 [alpha proteobacterium U9-1i]
MNADVSVALNVLALIGAAAYVLAQTRGASPVDQRLATLFALLMVLVGVRAMRWGFDLEVLRRVEEALAALVPLFALILAEGLMRRHAPGLMKRVLVAGALVFAMAGLLRPVSAAPAFAWMLGGFVALSLAAIAWLLASRERASLSRAENAAIGALFVGLVIALPLAATDFLAAAGVSPVRAGGLGLLVFIFAVARVTAHGGGGLAILFELLWSVAAAVLAFAVFAFVFDMPSTLVALRAFAIMLSLVLLFRIVQAVREQRLARRRVSFWRALAEAPSGDLDEFLDRVLDAPELERARVLDGPALAGYDQSALLGVFAGAPVLNVAETRGVQGGALEQLGVLFDEQEATHAVLVTQSPMRLLFVNMPRVGGGPDVDLQLRLLAKLAGQAVDD